MAACSKPFDPDYLTPRRTPRGPTFTLGSIAVDAARESPASHVDFAEAKQTATRAHGEIGRATSHADIDKAYGSARKRLEQALSTTCDARHLQSLKARLANLERAAAQRKTALDTAERARDEADQDWQRQIDNRLHKYIDAHFTPHQAAQLTPKLVAQARGRFEAAIARGIMKTVDVPRNVHLAGTDYPLEKASKTDLRQLYPEGVQYNAAGFPDLTSYAIKTVRLDHLLGDRTQDEKEANRRAGYDKTPDKYTWHHVEDRHTMQLVPTDLHGAVGHTGGFAAQKNVDEVMPLLTTYLLYAISRAND